MIIDQRVFDISFFQKMFRSLALYFFYLYFFHLSSFLFLHFFRYVLGRRMNESLYVMHFESPKGALSLAPVPPSPNIMVIFFHKIFRFCCGVFYTRLLCSSLSYVFLYILFGCCNLENWTRKKERKIVNENVL